MKIEKESYDGGGIRGIFAAQILKRIQDEMKFNFADKKQRDLQEMYSIPNVARKFLESFLAFRVPLGSKEPNIYQRLNRIEFDSIKKTRILRFVETHSHPRYESGVQDFDMTILSETPDIVTDLLELVKKEDEKHFNLLVQSIST